MMPCPDELTWSEYADGELSPTRADALTTHLAHCEACHALADSLSQEALLLREVLAEPVARPAATKADASAHVVSAGGRTAGWLAVAASVLLMGPWMFDAAWQAAPSLPSGLAWVKGAGGLGGAWTLCRGLWTYVFGGEDMWISLLGFGATSIVGVGVLAAASSRPWRPLAPAVGALLALLTWLVGPTQAAALDVRSTEGGTVRVDAGEVVDDSVALYGRTALVAGTIEGDLYVAAERVEVTGKVRGSLYGAAESLVVTGEVEGNVHAVGETVEVEAPVGGSALLLGENVILGERGSLAFGGFLGGETVRLKGRVGRDAYFGADEVHLSGTVAQSAYGWTNHFAMPVGGAVERDLHLVVTSEDAAEIDEGARIGGKTDVEVHEEEERRAFLHAGFYLFILAKAVALLLLGFVLVTLFPGLRPVAPSGAGQALRQMGAGFLVVVATPVALVIAALTLIGLPLAVAVAAVYGLVLFLSTLVVASFAGERLGAPRGPILRTVLVLLAILLVVEVPLVGPGLGFLVTLLGTGALSGHLWAMYRQGQAG